MSTSTGSERVHELVTAAARGDRGAQNQLFDQYWPLLRRVIRSRQQRMTPLRASEEDILDLAQSAAMEILRSLPKHQWRGRRAFIGWLCKVSEAVVIDAARYRSAKRRDQRAQTSLDDSRPIRPEGARAPESVLDQDRKLAELEGMLSKLKPQYAAAIQLHHMGYTHAEIGEMLDCTAEAARKLVTRGETKLLALYQSTE